jgi:hypothetical protein
MSIILSTKLAAVNIVDNEISMSAGSLVQPREPPWESPGSGNYSAAVVVGLLRI